MFAGDYALPDGKPRIGWLGGTKNGETPMVVTTVSADCCGLLFVGGRFIACTASGEILGSKDGLQFTSLANLGERIDDDGLRTRDGVLFLRTKSGVRSSTDAITWMPVANPPHIARAQSPGTVAIDCGWGGIDVTLDGTSYHRAKVPIDATGVCAVAYGVPLANLPPSAKPKKP